jgi:hypothetical protein
MEICQGAQEWQVTLSRYQTRRDLADGEGLKRIANETSTLRYEVLKGLRSSVESNEIDDQDELRNLVSYGSY